MRKVAEGDRGGTLTLIGHQGVRLFICSFLYSCLEKREENGGSVWAVSRFKDLPLILNAAAPAAAVFTSLSSPYYYLHHSSISFRPHPKVMSCSSSSITSS